MTITVSARKIELTEGLRAHVEKKYEKLQKFFKDDAEVKVTLWVEKDRQMVETTIFSQGTIIRVEEVNSDMYAAIDKSVGTIERKIRKNKTRLEKRLREGSLLDMTILPEDEEEEKEFNIVKNKTFNIKPMSAEEAILQMNLLGHQFFVFTNDEDETRTNIVYKRKDGNYGLIEVK